MTIAERHIFNNVQEAIAFAVGLKKEHGFDLFRGQIHPWNLKPSLFRKKKADREEALKELQHFYEWASHIYPIHQFHYDKDSLKAIAQHYHLATPFLDVTSDPEIAGFFALDGIAPEESHYSVIFCGRTAELNKIKGIRIIHIEVANLWRLEAQKGFFIVFDHDIDISHLKLVQILFKREGNVKLNRNNIYVQEKSALEIELDHYFYRRPGEELNVALERLEEKGALRSLDTFKYRTYPGAFIRRSPPINKSWLDISKAWVTRQREPYTSIELTKKVIQIDLLEGDDPVNFFDKVDSQLALALKNQLHQRKSASFQILAKDFEKNIRNLIEHRLKYLWDSLRRFPYPDIEITRCIASFLTTVYFNLKWNEKDSKRIFQRLHGPSITILFSAYGGSPDGSLVSEKALGAAIDASFLQYLNPYYKRKCSDTFLFTFMFLVEPHKVFKFDGFRKLFCEELLPTALADNMTEHIRDDLRQPFTYSHVHDPVNIAWWTISDYSMHSPFAFENNLDDKLIIFEDMSEMEIRADAVAAICKSFKDEMPFKLKFAGFERDPREIWNIPRVQELATSLLKFGVMSILEPTTFLEIGDIDPTSQGEEDRKSYIGAFELWLLAYNLLQDIFGMTYSDIFENLWPQFLKVLQMQNQIALEIYETESKIQDR